MPQTEPPAPPEGLTGVETAAEENLLGACLLSTTAIEHARERLDPSDFYRHSHGAIFRVCVELLDSGSPVDPVTVSAQLRTQGILAEVGGEARIAELAMIVPAVSSAGTYAQIVRDAARARYATAVAMRLQDAARNGGLRRHPELLHELEQLIDSPSGVTQLRPLWWHEALNEEIPETTEYVRDVLQAGVLADIVGLPYLHKTAVALELATKVARGNGHFLGQHEVTKQANAAYFWADDSRAKELERIQSYARVHGLETLPVGLYLNPGITLPDDIPTVKAQIREHGYRLVVFDSLYNFAPGIDFTKDHAKVTALYHALKRVCDQIEGLTIVVVDHAAKPSESNKGRHSSHTSFGSIFKAASVRCTIAIERANGKDQLYVSATGNNVRGFPRTPAYWSGESLEVRIVETAGERRQELEEAVEEMLRKEVVGWLRDHESDPKERTRNAIRKGLRRGRPVIDGVLERLHAEGYIEDQNAPPSLPGTEADGSRAQSGLLPDEPGNGPRPKGSGLGRAQSWRIIRDPFNQAEEPDPARVSGSVGSTKPGRDSEVDPSTEAETVPLYVVEGTSDSPAKPVGSPSPDDDDLPPIDDYDLPEV